MKIKIIYKSRVVRWFFPKYFVGFTLGRTIRMRGIRGWVSKELIAHEVIHVLQYKKYGVIGFLIRYLVESIRHGYSGNTLEIEAYQNQNNISQEVLQLIEENNLL